VCIAYVCGVGWGWRDGVIALWLCARYTGSLAHSASPYAVPSSCIAMAGIHAIAFAHNQLIPCRAITGKLSGFKTALFCFVNLVLDGFYWHGGLTFLCLAYMEFDMVTMRKFHNKTRDESLCRSDQAGQVQYICSKGSKTDAKRSCIESGEEQLEIKI
jgi:hypothetical protein